MLCNVYETGPQQSLEVNEKKIKGKKKQLVMLTRNWKVQTPLPLRLSHEGKHTDHYTGDLFHKC